ncbi:DUF2178 domain-containing protein [Archaeoglobus sp.]
MDRKRFALFGTALAVVLGATVGYAVESRQPYLAVIAVIAALVLLRVARGRVDEVLEDERIERVSERASRRTLELFGMSAALLSALLIAMGNDAGYVLGFAVCAILILYIGFYAFYSRRAV